MMYFEIPSYKVRLSCDFCADKTAVDFEGQSRKTAYEAAYQAGWRTVPLTGKARCPRCGEHIKPGNHRSNRKE